MIAIAKYSSTIEYNLKTTLDSSGITKLQQEIAQLEVQLTRLSSRKLISDSDFNSAQTQIKALKTAISKSYNSKLGLIDWTSFNSSFKTAKGNVQDLITTMNKGGVTGKNTLTQTISTLGQLDTKLSSVSKATEKVFNTIGNTVRWGVVASGFQEVMNAAHEAVEYVKDLDTSLTNIMMVTDESRSSMNEYAKSANEAAKALGSTTVAMTDATTVFAQQGFNLDQSQQLATLSTKLANASQQDTSTTSDQITAYMNAYGMSDNMEELSKALDAWAEVANVSAADVEELATASQKAASTASTVGVNMDQLASQIATIESVTKDAPENIGNGLKTIYARFSDIGMGETLDDGVTLGTVTGTLDKIGVQVLDEAGKMRDVGDIMEDLMDVWDTMDSTSKNSVATTLAGKYQLSRFEALMNSSDMYEEYKQSAQEGKDKGTLDVMNEKYTESLQGKLNKLQASAEGIINSLFNSSDFYGFIDGLSTALDLLGDFVDSLGDAQTIMLGIASIAGKAFKGQIAGGISNIMTNVQKRGVANKNQEANDIALQAFNKNRDALTDEQKNAVDTVMDSRSLSKYMNEDQRAEQQRRNDAYINSAKEYTAAQAAYDDKMKGLQAAYSIMGAKDAVTGDAKNGWNHSILDQMFTSDNLNTKITQKDIQDYGIGQIATSFGNADNAAKKLKETLGEISSEEDLTEEQIDDILNKISNTKKALENIDTTNGTINDEIREMMGLLDQINTSVGSGKKGNDEAKEAAEKLANKTKDNQEKAEKATKVPGTTKEDIEALENKVADAKSAMDSNKRQVKGGIQNAQQTKKIQSALSVLNGISSLTFSAEALSNLKSVWDDDSLSGSEKLTQTITNLAGTIPMAAAGVGELREGFSGLSKAGKIAAGSLGAIVAVISLVSMAVSAYNDNIDAQISKEQELVTKQKEQSDSISQTVSSWKELYKTYQQTGQVTDEFRTSSEQIIQSLKLQGQEANIAAGNYTALASAIDQANQKELKDTISEAQKANSEGGSLYKSLTGGKLFDGGLVQDINSAAFSFSSLEERNQYGVEAWGGDTSDVTGMISFARSQVDNLNTQISNLGNSYDEYKKKAGDAAMTQAQWNTKTTQLNTTLTKFNDVLDSEDVQNWVENAKTAADATLQLSSFTSKISSQGKNLDSLYNIFSSTSGVSDYFNQLSGDDQWSYILDSGVLSDAQKQAVEYQQALTNLGRSAYFSNDNSDEKASSIVNTVQKRLTDKDDFIEFVGSMDVDATEENINNLVDQYLNNKITVSFVGSIDTTDLKTAQSSKSTFADLLDSYETAYQSKGGFTEDEAASLVAENSNYLQYLTKVGEVYQLNEKALDAWTEKTREQTDAMQELRGETADMSGQQGTINSILGNKTEESDWMNGLLTDMRELNYQFSNGDIDTSTFMDGLSDACDGLSDRVHQLGDNWKYFISDVNNANFASNFVDELYQGLTQANKQYKAGTITIGDYSTTVKKAAASAINLSIVQTKANTVFKDGKLYYKNTNTEVKNLDEREASLSNETKELIKQYQNLDAATDFDNFVTDNFEAMLQIFDDSGKVLDSVTTSAGGISAEYEDTIQGLASTMAEFYSKNEDAATQVAAQISSVSGMTVDQATDMIKSSEQLSTEMMANTQVAGTAMQGTMTQTESAISDMGSGISGIITAILSSISSLNGAGVEGTVETNDGESKEIEITTSDGDSTQIGTLHVPGFSMKLNSSGSSNSSKASELTSDGWTKGTVDTGNKDNGNSTGYWTQYTRPNEEKEGGVEETWIASSSDDIISYSSNKLATGLQSLLGSSNASLKDYAPVGYGTSPSSYGKKDYSDGDGDGSGGSGGSGDSGDSGSDDNYDDSTEEYLEDELDLYEKVNTELDKVEGHLDNISEDYDRLIGFNKTANMEEQIADYQKLIALQEEKLNIEKQEAEDYRNRLSSYGITFDSEGVVQNYADIYNQLKNNYNALVDEYNASTDKAYKETLKTQMEEAQDAFDKYNDYIDRYDELIGDEIQSTENQIKEYYHEIEDLRIEALEDAYKEIETLQDLENVWNKLQGMWSGYKSDSPFRQMIVDQADLADYFNMTASAASKMFNTIIKKNRELAEQATTDEERDRYNAIADWHEQAQNDFSADNNTGVIGYYTKFLEYMNSDDAKNLYGSNEAQYIEDLQQAYEDTANAILDAEEKYEDIIDDVIDAYDDINDRLEDRIDDYEDIADQLDHTLNQIETLFGDEQYDKTIKIAQKQADVYTQATAEAEKQLEYWNTQLTQAIAQGLDDEIIDDLKDKVQSAQETINDLAESAAEAVRKVYDTETDKYLSDFEEKVYGAYKTTDSDGNTVTWDSDFLNMQWEQAKTNADQYLDTVERTYQVEKLRNKYQQMMNDTNDPAIQKQIANAMNEQLNYLNRIDEATGEKVKLSEYDLEYANAQLEVLQKRIALEEAQRNKSQMKLKRDSQGNYSYVYTANEDDTLSAQQELSDAEYNGYEISKDNYSSQMDNYMSALNTFVENARSIREKYAGDEATATAQIQALWEQTSEYLAGIAQQMGVSETGMLDSIKQLALDSVGEVSDSYNNIASSMEENMEDALQNIGVAVNTSCVSQIKDLESVDEAASQLQNDLTESAEEYVDKAADIASAAKESYTDVTNAINNATKAQQELTAESTKFWNLVDEDTNVVNSQLSNLQSLKDALNDVKSQYSQTAQALKDALSQLEQKTAEASYWEGVANGTISRGGSDSGSGGGGGTTATGYSADEDTAWGIAKAIWTYSENGWGNDPTRHAYLTEAFGEDFANYVQDIINNYSNSGALADENSYEYFRENVLGYDTGGYTGSWSDKTDDEKNGKLALLHQKELVLNATDTQNILSAVDIIRNMTDSLKAGGLSTSLNTVLQGLTDSTASMGNSVEQDVHITAEFPNASDASEIREALLSLNDRAYQKSSQASDYSNSTRSWYYGD